MSHKIEVTQLDKELIIHIKTRKYKRLGQTPQEAHNQATKDFDKLYYVKGATVNANA